MKIAVVGAGAMGILFAGCLCRSGYSPWLLDKSQESVDAIKEGGLRLQGVSGSHHLPFQTITTRAEEIGTVDLIIMFVKAYDTEEAMRGALSLMGDRTVVLTLQNGLNNLETIAGLVGRKRIIGGVTAHGATRLGPGHIRHAGVGETVIGSLMGESVEQLVETQKVLDTSGISTRLTDDVEGILWSKLMINAAINPLTALTRLTNGEITQYAELMDVQLRVVEEACLVAKAKGVTIHYSNPFKTVRDVCKNTAANRSSMLQDILSGKKTEIDSINGAVVAEGSRHRVSTPYNDILTRLVQALEVRSLK